MVLKNLVIVIVMTGNIMYSPLIFSLHVLHLSFHKGCINEINYIAQKLNFTVTSLFVPAIAPQEWDGISMGNVLYNVGHDRAARIWNKHKDYFNQFDAIITSDTAPLARIFLQNNYEKPIIMWICNRFDYCDYASLDCEFPDEEYYQLLRDAYDKKNVYMIPYNAFESFYALQKKVIFNCEVIKPIGVCASNTIVSAIPSYINKQDTFFIPPYLNDLAVNLIQQCGECNIPMHQGRYNGPYDLKEFKGIIHIPYAWSNVAFFENIQHGLPYFVPSHDFMIKLYDNGTIWWQNGTFFRDNFRLSEWYNEENKKIITYFDSWEDLKYKIETIDFAALRNKIKQYAHHHEKNTLKKWSMIIHEIASKNN